MIYCCFLRLFQNILFSENIVSAQQLLTLNYTMQAAMAEAHKPPLFIAVDQEGGRVARLPSHMLTPFAGNLAIGASYHEHGTAFAKNVAQGIGGVLRPLGINTNFASSIDINSEPKNPVINVRSFGEKPERVAELGESFVAALQAEGVMSAVKHFPGHGDTSVDSHLELPIVEKEAPELEEVCDDGLDNDGNGIMDMTQLQKLLEVRADEIAVVSLMWCNNETGVIEPIEKASALCKQFGVLLHSDGTQWVAKMPVDISEVKVDLLVPCSNAKRSSP